MGEVRAIEEAYADGLRGTQLIQDKQTGQEICLIELDYVADVDAHDKTIIDNLNAVVQPDDTLYHLGDFTMRGGPTLALHYREQINCKNIILILGNHDHGKKGVVSRRYYDIFEVHKTLTVALGGIFFLCTHDPDYSRAPNLHGHSHHSIPWSPKVTRCDLGVDAWNFMPVRKEKIVADYKRWTEDRKLPESGVRPIVQVEPSWYKDGGG